LFKIELCIIWWHAFAGMGLFYLGMVVSKGATKTIHKNIIMAHNKTVNTVYASYFSRYCGGLHPQPEQVTSASLETNPLATSLLSNDLTSQTSTKPPTLTSLAILATCLFSNQIQDLSSNQPYYVPHNLATALFSNQTP